MLWPDDADARVRAVKASSVEFLRPILAEAEIARLAEEDVLSELQEEVKKERFVRGLICGMVLHEILRLLISGSQEASMSKVIDKCVKPFLPKKENNNKAWPRYHAYRISKKTFQNEAWRTFRPVAPFWAAYYAACPSGLRSPADWTRATFPCHSAGLGRFLADAEFFRVRGIQARTWRSPKKTILQQEETVQIPPALHIEPTKGLWLSEHERLLLRI